MKASHTAVVHLRIIPSVEKQRSIMQDVAGRRGKVEVEVLDAEDDIDFAGMVFADGTVKSGVFEKLKRNQRICKGGDEVVPTFVAELIALL